jgi:hypothetical protein
MRRGDLPIAPPPTDHGALPMYREKLRAPTLETCPHRHGIQPEATPETATCGILRAIFGDEPIAQSTVVRDVCDACCRSFPPSAGSWNPVVASLVYERASGAIETASGEDLERLQRLCATALERLDVVYLAPLSAETPGFEPVRPLAEVLPPPKRRNGQGVRQWAVGVTTAPRLHGTLDRCLGSLVRAGWRTPHLFVDSAVRIPQEFSHLPGTFRDVKIGAWPSYYLALAELLMRHPHADAYLIAQDDTLFYDRESLVDYLEEVLWPGGTPGLVSLYCGPADCGSRPGWQRKDDSRNSGPLATIFPRELAKAFIADAGVFEHRWSPDPALATSVDDVVSHWARDRGYPLWLPTPSLVQHIGDTSTLWPRARALGHRRASQVAGEEAGSE